MNPKIRDRAAKLRAVLPAPKPTNAPQDTGTILANLDRGDSELHVTWSQYEANPYVGLRLWRRDASGVAWPSKEGVTIRLRELPEMIEALDMAVEMATGHFQAKAGKA